MAHDSAVPSTGAAPDRCPPAVVRLSAGLALWMRNPVPAQPGVCECCLTPCSDYARCHRCRAQPGYADAVLFVSYSRHAGPLHDVLHDYKRGPARARRALGPVLAAVLWRFLARHEACLSRACGVERFDCATTVPSGRGDRPGAGDALSAVTAAAAPLGSRHRTLLSAASAAAASPGGRGPRPGSGRRVDPDRFDVAVPLEDRAVLLIDDTWITGATVHSAAGALKRAGASRVGAVVLARHLHPEFASNGGWLAARSPRFEWATCALHAARSRPAAGRPASARARASASASARASALSASAQRLTNSSPFTVERL